MTAHQFAHNGKPLVPPLKWAGGKRWAAAMIKDALPTEYGCYFEPFLGGGAAFFSIGPKTAVLSDTNGELIDTYRAIRRDWGRVWTLLCQHDANHSDSYFYEVRAQASKDIFEIAARLLYLNRTCWNGLYRVNKYGDFNVPRGTKDAVFLETDNPPIIARLLRNAHLVCSDFELVIEMARSGDVVYADPPYTVRHNLNGFLKYNESIFTWSDQERLAEALRRARARGVFVLVSNANHLSIRHLYRADFEIRTISRTSVLAAGAAFRGKTSELLITGRPRR